MNARFDLYLPSDMRTKKKQKKTKIEPGDRLIFQLPEEMIPDFNDLKSVGFGDTEIVVDCLKLALADVKAELLKKRATEAADLYAKQANYLKPGPGLTKAPASLPQTGPAVQTHVTSDFGRKLRARISVWWRDLYKGFDWGPKSYYDDEEK